MKSLVIASLLTTFIAGAVPAMAQYVGPDGSPKTIKEIQSTLLRKDHLVTLKGHITRRVAHDLYEFSDGTGTLYLDVDAKVWSWPADLKVDEKTLVEVHGKYIDKTLEHDKIKVIELRVAQK